jgi:hypothetical protein
MSERDLNKRPYADDYVGLVKTAQRLAALRLAAQHELFFVPGIPNEMGTFMYEPKLGDIELVDFDLGLVIRDLRASRYLSRTDGRMHEQLDRPTSLLINDKGVATLERWEKREAQRIKKQQRGERKCR